MDIYDLRKELGMGKSIYELPLKVTFYARVSTGTDEQAHSLKNQINYYRDFIGKNPNWTYVEGYIDEALSGTSVTKRESFLKMIDDSKLDKFDLLITKEISRFSRNTLDSIKYTQELLKNGVGVIFQTDNINTLMPDAELRLTIMSSIAQDEVRKISERVKFGFKRAIDNGVVLGNSRIWGYTKENGKLVVVPEEAEIVKSIFEMYAIDRMGVRAICKVLAESGFKNTKGNDFSFTTVRNIIANPKYKGYYCGNKTQKYDYRSNDRKVFEQSEWVMYKDEENVPEIVTEELWDKANAILNKRSQKHRAENISSYNNKYKYSCKVICGEHKTFFYRSLFRYKTGNKEVWQCKLYSEKGREACTAPVVYTSELDEIMKDAYKQLVKERTNIIHELVQIYSSISSKSSIKEDIAKLQVEINDIMRRKDKLLDLSIKGMLYDSEFEKRNTAFNLDIEKNESKILNLKQEEEKNKEVIKTVESLRQIIADELDFKDGFDNSIIDTLLDKIEVYGTGDKKIINLKVFFKVFEDEQNYVINRRDNTSVCTTSHT
ncbi:MAG: recombinase family protein [Clostridia bacterium]